MSGYLEVKYPFKANLGLNPFKSWKRQWCIIRPSPTCSGGGSLAVYCSEAGAPAGTVELPSGCVVRRAKSRSRPHAFAVFSDDEPRKPRILLAAQTLNDTLAWMEKIRDVLSGSKLLERYNETIFDALPTYLLNICEVCGSSQCPYCAIYNAAFRSLLATPLLFAALIVAFTRFISPNLSLSIT